MASLPAFLYKKVDGSVQAKECRDIATFKRYKKDGWVDSPAGMSDDFPLPEADGGEAKARTVAATQELQEAGLTVVKDAPTNRRAVDELDDDDLDLESTGEDVDDLGDEDEIEEEPPATAPKKKAAAKKGAPKSAPKAAKPAAGKPLDILTLSPKDAEKALAGVEDVNLLKKIRDREKKNPKTKGGRKAVLSVINARIAELV